MLVNFAIEAVGTKVSSNKISTDGYECGNLISSRQDLRRKGFIAEHFIKPPVDITFRFPCNVNLYCILLNPFVGRQHVLQVDVFSASKPLPKTDRGKMKRFNKNMATSTESSLQVDDDSLPIFYSISKMHIPSPHRVGFRNNNFPVRICQGNNLNLFDSTMATAQMNHPRKHLLSNCSQLQIRLSRIQNGSTPAICNIEIWGVVALGESDILRNSIYERYQGFINSLRRPTTPPPVSASTSLASNEIGDNSSNNTAKVGVNENDHVDIPEEFLDSLTFEIMAIPISLPCGKNVDKRTLDRYIDSEASHGRQPRDPFTGIPFSADAQPIPNGFLKARIDSFMSENSNHPSLSSVPRTASRRDTNGSSTFLHGNRKRQNDAQISTIVKKVGEVSTLTSLPVSSSSNIIESSNRSSSSNSETMTRNNCLPSSTSSKDFIASQFHDQSNSTLTSSNNNSSYEASHDKNTYVPKTKTADHEASLKNSLDFALSALLGSSSNSAATVVVNDQTKSSPADHELQCSKCKSCLSEGTLAYNSPHCIHIICRLCLLNSTAETGANKIVCSICGIRFSKAEVVRTHIK